MTEDHEHRPTHTWTEYQANLITGQDDPILRGRCRECGTYYEITRPDPDAPPLFDTTEETK